ncbi:PREDICTED: collagen alpha-1(II) chain-like [Cyphomyrmex costatus]|uniref:collagen alpha-1(II) chain-like n=1 Tax=Cyphomyrmex costatus TaxID=456900 RepID=UPI00085233D2|nr:PREDICTED: collagen alpha-1(II) chain-like [Cyphomyrmex costatus]
MRLCLIVLIFLASTALARYHEKTRFDRSIHEYNMRNVENNNEEKQWSFNDDITQFVAYKSREENDCYLEDVRQGHNMSRKKRQFKILYASAVLTKLEAWRLAGGRIVDFCNGRNILLLQTMRPVPEQSLDLFFNKIPVDENNISSKRIADMVLIPLKARTKRQIQLEQREKLNKNVNRIRKRRQTNQFRGKFRGQTQSQYLNFANDEKKEGKAEAEATQQTSRAVVSGSRGMGQAQSMSSGGTGCEDCPGYPGYLGYPGIERAPDKVQVPPMGIDGYVQVPGVGTPGIAQPGVVTGIPSYPGRQITYPTGVVPGEISTYPGIRPGKPETYPGGVRPGIVTPGVEGTYPGGVRPGIVTPGVDGTYPGGVRPGIVTPGVDGTYPGGVRPGIVTPGTDRIYPGGVQPPGTMIPGGDRTYPPGILITGDRGLYPGEVLPGVTVGVGTYPGGIQPGVQPGQSIYPPGIVTTSVTTGATAVTGVGTYPISTPPGTGLPSGTYPGTGVPSARVPSTVVPGTGVPGTGVPSTRIPGIEIPGTGISGTGVPGTGVPGTGVPGTGVSGTGIPGTGVYPGIRPEAIPGTSVGTYPGSVVPGTVTQGIYPGQQTVVYRHEGVPSGTLPSGGQVPSTITTTTSGTGTQVITYPGGRPTNGQTVYPGPSDTIQHGRIPEGTGTQVVYPGVTYPGTIPGTYPGGAQQIPSAGGTLYPSQAIYPGGQVPTAYPSGQYPGTGIAIPGTGIQYPTGITGGTDGTRRYLTQFPGGISLQEGSIRKLEEFYPGMVGPAGIEESRGLTGPAGPAGMVDDGTESQASSSVQQVDLGTQASASAQGKYRSGTAQSQVMGTYSDSGTFSAQAGTSDANKSAQTEISGGKEGATSNAQGVAGYGKSQAQVQLDSDSGATSTGAQSSGWNHGTNSQVQASSKGGMADAQANGEGSTSSQAQIGFQPYLKSEDENVEKHESPFRGSGTASAQSGTHRGQSQSQLQGSFQYGITYTGAAQAGSGSGAASSRKPFNFTDSELFKPFKPAPSPKRPTNINSVQSSPSINSNNNRQDENKQNREQGLQNSSTSRQTVVLASKNNLDNTDKKKMLSTEKPRTDETAYDEYDDDYTDEDDYPTGSKLTIKEKFSETFPGTNPSHQKLNKSIQQQSRSQSQTIQVAKENQYNIHVKQDSNIPRTDDTLQPGQSVSGYTIPPGFRGRVMSASGTETVAQGDGKSQSQTVSLVPKDLNNTKSSLVTETRSLRTNHNRYIDRPMWKNQEPSVNQNISFDKRAKPTPAVAAKPSYYTVTNSFAGKMNGSNEPRKYEHRYYTKSSTCGYFTFSCNVVYGSNGRTKICKPKVPTYPDGTPIRC